MSITTVTSREFNQGASRVKRASRNGPVFITERGKPAHVLLSIEDYQKLAAGERSLADQFKIAEAADVPLELPPRQPISLRRIPFLDDPD